VRGERYIFLDGLRGWAALAVLLYHLFVEDFCIDRSAAGAPAILDRFILFNGTAAVFLFFVISGFSLSIAYVRHRDGTALARMAASRYPRLAIPVLAACAFAFVLIVSGAIPPSAQRPENLQSFLLAVPSVTDLLRSSLFDTFFDHSARMTYVPPLWTMHYELVGSVLIFVLLGVFGRLRRRLWFYFAALPLAAAWAPHYAAFIAGLIIAECYHRRPVTGADPRWWALALFASGCIVVAVEGSMRSLIMCAGMVALCAGVTWNISLRSFFENRTARFLGWISFPLYLTHSTIEFSMSARIDTALANLAWEPRVAHLIVGLVSAPVAIMIAVMFTPINDGAVIFSRWFGRTFVAFVKEFLLHNLKIKSDYKLR
jgi:peptidoglycan/LPS O-acetylase OafA/YrhL